MPAKTDDPLHRAQRHAKALESENRRLRHLMHKLMNGPCQYRDAAFEALDALDKEITRAGNPVVVKAEEGVVERDLTLRDIVTMGTWKLRQVLAD